MKDLNEKGMITFDVDGVTVELTKDDLLIETAQSGRYVTKQEGDVTVVLDIELTEELIEEGFVREIISKIQTMRKDTDFVVTDKIKVFVSGNDKIAELMKKKEEEIKDDVLAVSVEYDATTEISKEWNINGEKVTLGVVLA